MKDDEVSMHVEPKTIVCYTLEGALYEYETGDYLRQATEDESAESDAAFLINGTGAFDVEIEDLEVG